jgi:phage baseplate assembly protein V
MTAQDIFKVVQTFTKPLSTRIKNMVSRGVVQLVDDGTKIQTIQADLLEGETRDDIERVQNYGFTSVPKSGAEAVVIFVGGTRDHGLAVAVDDRRYRKTGLQPGEVAVYRDNGDSIVLKSDGSIEINSTGAIKLNGGGAALIPVAKEGSLVTGTAGPFPVTATVQVGAGSANVKVP